MTACKSVWNNGLHRISQRLVSLCMKNGIKYKGKTKAQLNEELACLNVDDGAISEKFAKDTVTIMKTFVRERVCQGMVTKVNL